MTTIFMPTCEKATKQYDVILFFVFLTTAYNTAINIVSLV